jgi:DNA-binding SARP family transcriptional activator
VEIHDLGALRIDTDGIEVALNGRRLESMLAILCVNAEEVVTVDALIDAVWGGSAPARAAQSLESLVWRLRKILEPGRAAREAATVLQTEDLGYRLALPRANVDSHRLMEAAREVAELIAAGRFGAALELADGVLPRWRGQPYLGVPDAEWMPPIRAQLAEAHLELQQHRVEALLAKGQPERALSELAGLLTDHPYRERLWGQRMIALYRSGRQSDALAAFADARQVLADELGLDPGPALRDLHERPPPRLGSPEYDRRGASSQSPGRPDRTCRRPDPGASRARTPPSGHAHRPRRYRQDPARSRGGVPRAGELPGRGLVRRPRRRQ